jgi:hypothetical protein
LDAVEPTASEKTHMNITAQKSMFTNIDIAVLGENQTFAEEFIFFDSKAKFTASCMSSEALM